MENNQSYVYSSLEDRPDIAIIKLHNEVLGGADALAFSSLIQELKDKPFKTAAVDLSGVGLINSSGLGMLVSGLSSLRKHSINFVLFAVPDKVINILEVTHLNKVFKISKDIDALKSEF